MEQKAPFGANDRDWQEISNPALLPSKPMVSVLMLTYNHAPYLGEAIDAILAQQIDFDIEIVIGEDCSIDGSREIAIEYQRCHPETIRVLYSDANVGMMQNFLRILEAAKGEYFAICEGDDYWNDPLKLQLQVSALAALPACDICFHCCMMRTRDQPGLTGPIAVAANTDRIVDFSKVIVGGGAFMPSASLLIRSAAIRNIRSALIEKAPMMDYFIQLYGARRGGALYLNRPMSVYRVGLPHSFSALMVDADRNREFQCRFNDALQEAERDFPDYLEQFDQFSYVRGKCIAYASASAGDKRLHELALRMLAHRQARLSVMQRLWLRMASRIRICALMARMHGLQILVRRIQRRLFSRDLVPWLVQRYNAWRRAGA